MTGARRRRSGSESEADQWQRESQECVGKQRGWTARWKPSECGRRHSGQRGLRSGVSNKPNSVDFMVVFHTIGNRLVRSGGVWKLSQLCCSRSGHNEQRSLYAQIA